MKIIDLKNGNEVNRTEGPLCLLLGNFDGVHEGHSRLIDVALEEGRLSGIKTAAWTFEDHPLNSLSGQGVACLTSSEEKNEIFTEKKLDYVIYEDFSKVKDLSPKEFIDNILIDRFDCRTVVCGFNFKFGKNGGGTPELLNEQMEAYGRRAVVVPPVYRMNKIVSSTAIRFYVENGLMEEAEEMLGRPYSVKLPVLHGHKLGRTIGLPTINQKFPKKHIKPKNGIYACTCQIGSDIYLGVSNVGSRPTVNENENDINCETHIINYNGDLYGRDVKVCFYKRLRDEKRFADIDGLKRAVKRDVEAALEYFSKK